MEYWLKDTLELSAHRNGGKNMKSSLDQMADSQLFTTAASVGYGVREMCFWLIKTSTNLSPCLFALKVYNAEVHGLPVASRWWGETLCLSPLPGEQESWQVMWSHCQSWQEAVSNLAMERCWSKSCSLQIRHSACVDNVLRKICLVGKHITSRQGQGQSLRCPHHLW